MHSRWRLLSLMCNARLAPAGRLAAAPSSRSFGLPPAAAGGASTSGSSDGHLVVRAQPMPLILIGQAG
ncbi:hypothetical protein ZWY2020_006284 [Hordeum vulgare]|nr:hypothetical protein ZWY2020_006284 [Hordeum vulgare]